MKPETRDARREQIMDAAVELLTEQGYRDASMLAVARRASASKETLYAWFGDKRGLYEAVIRRNAETVRAALAPNLVGGAPVQDALRSFGAALFGMLTSESAVAVNRAAIAEARSDPSLAETLARLGRDATLPAFVGYLEARAADGALDLDAPDVAAEAFLGLLLGDIQLRRLLGVAPAPSAAEIEARAKRAVELFMALYAG